MKVSINNFAPDCEEMGFAFEELMEMLGPHFEYELDQHLCKKLFTLFPRDWLVDKLFSGQQADFFTFLLKTKVQPDPVELFYRVSQLPQQHKFKTSIIGANVYLVFETQWEAEFFLHFLAPENAKLGSFDGHGEFNSVVVLAKTDSARAHDMGIENLNLGR